MMRPILVLALMLAACDRGPEAPTAAENKQLDEMERTLDAEAKRDGNGA